LFIVGRCRDLPGKPFIWRVRLASGCTLEKSKPEATGRRGMTGHMFEVDDDTNVEVRVNLRQPGGKE
jgi:hypothetical protein